MSTTPKMPPLVPLHTAAAPSAEEGEEVPLERLEELAARTPKERAADLAKYPDDVCAHCHKHSAATLQQCGECRAARYCSKACQRAHWAKHGPLCIAEDAPHRRAASVGAGWGWGLGLGLLAGVGLGAATYGGWRGYGYPGYYGNPYWGMRPYGYY